jgi:hypothetical protein
MIYTTFPRSTYGQRTHAYNKMKVNVISMPVMRLLVATLLTGDMYLTMYFNNLIQNMFALNVYVTFHKCMRVYSSQQQTPMCDYRVHTKCSTIQPFCGVTYMLQ